MKRKDFIKAAGLGLISVPMISSLSKLKNLTDDFAQTERMPALFLGHGSPMNAIEDNEFVQGFKDQAKQLEKPNAIIVVSAHWETRGTYVTAMENPRTIHDFGGFPQALFDQQYPAPGHPALAQEVANLVQPGGTVHLDDKWGLDHGSWTVVKHMFPDADVPVIQLSIDRTQTPAYHYQLAQQLKQLRDKGVLIIGSGNIGWALKQLLKKDYDIKQGDIEDGFDANDLSQVADFLKGVDAVISAGPFAVNKNIASVAAENGIAYFDLTEDVETTEYIRSLKSENILMPQCGLAPGAINICAAGMMNQFDTVNEVLMRVGALPRFTTNEMSYYLSWSTNGLINEYCNEADAIYDGKSVKVMPLEGAEKIVIEGESFEAFNTSGGCATMCETFKNKVQNLSYKTIRYPGHLNHMKFLFNDLHLKKNKNVLEKLFDKEVPRTKNDVIIFFVKVIGLIDGVLQEKTYLRKIYGNEKFSAIQLTTASGVCSVLKMFLDGKITNEGFTKQESLSWDDFLNNNFGKVYA